MLRTKPNGEADAARRSREHLPLTGYSALSGIYAATLTGFFAWANSRGKLGEIPLADILVLGVGTHKAARMLSRDKVLTFVRKPVTVYEDTDGAPPGEVYERQRSDGSPIRRAIADLITCPYCMSPWVAAGLFGIYVTRRPLGQALGGLLTVISLSDFVHTAWADVTS